MEDEYKIVFKKLKGIILSDNQEEFDEELNKIEEIAKLSQIVLDIENDSDVVFHTST